MVARASSAVDSSDCQSTRGLASKSAQRWNEGYRSSHEEGQGEEERGLDGSHPTVVGYESTGLATRPSVTVLVEVLWTAVDGSGSQGTNNIVYFSNGSHRRSAFQFAPRG